jgi:hypothetical protein
MCYGRPRSARQRGQSVRFRAGFQGFLSFIPYSYVVTLPTVRFVAQQPQPQPSSAREEQQRDTSRGINLFPPCFASRAFERGQGASLVVRGMHSSSSIAHASSHFSWDVFFVHRTSRAVPVHADALSSARLGELDLFLDAVDLAGQPVRALGQRQCVFEDVAGGRIVAPQKVGRRHIALGLEDLEGRRVLELEDDGSRLGGRQGRTSRLYGTAMQLAVLFRSSPTGASVLGSHSQ